MIDHDGETEGDGGIARWLHLTTGLGLDRDFVISTRGILPATRFAVEAYVHFCRERTLLEAIASSLTELFSPQIIGERIEGMLKHYDFVTADTLAYFTKRPPQAQRDSDFALAYVCKHARNKAEQQSVLDALRFKCDVLWVQLDALWHAYVEGQIPPGAWRPGGGCNDGRARPRALRRAHGRACRAGCASNMTMSATNGCCSRPSAC